MDYKSKARELRSITRQLRLLNPFRRDHQLKEDEFIENLKNIGRLLSTGRISAMQAVANCFYNIHKYHSQPAAPRKFKQGGIVHKERNMEEYETVIPSWILTSNPDRTQDFKAIVTSKA